MKRQILYTDGHGVMVTDSMFYAKKHSYLLVGIAKHQLSVIKPMRSPWLMMFFIGMTMFMVSMIRIITPSMIPDFLIFDFNIHANDLIFLIGWTLMLLGLLMLAVVRERYAVTILTHEGRKDAIVSTQKDYVSQIVYALDKAKK